MLQSTDMTNVDKSPEMRRIIAEGQSFLPRIKAQLSNLSYIQGVQWSNGGRDSHSFSISIDPSVLKDRKPSEIRSEIQASWSDIGDWSFGRVQGIPYRDPQLGTVILFELNVTLSNSNGGSDFIG